MSKLLCVGGPLDGKRVELLNGREMVYTEGEDDDRILHKYVCEQIAEGYFSREILAHSELTGGEVIHKLLEGYNPGKETPK